MEKIWVIEDDESIRGELQKLLRANGYQPVEGQPCDLVLLDINLPGENGFEICQKIRRQSDVPVIFLTARDSREDEILGFGMGADDFIRKPYDSSVLLARIGRLLKRRERSVLTVRDLTLNLAELTVAYGDKQEELTRNEMRILACLMQRRMCTREEIIEELWKDSLYIDDNTLGVNISRLREKLKRLGADDYIRTVRGVGYRV
ncbi:MAG TPA: response regulator transcription factor [Candidatus Pullilachnospira stercoravium]|uniref:Stage 0 sporulation protein A homolog n=1 Tax=Candidatus Pullilachnospira stercoravium TaxID=2840913 RepID=A0A9D1NS44_9FIRM|nr:response regulator transcription factor [Candidatus Pullilachnospira stercoravium]